MSPVQTTQHGEQEKNIGAHDDNDCQMDSDRRNIHVCQDNDSIEDKQ